MKDWYKSRTLWVNVITLLLLILDQTMGWNELQPYAPQMVYAINILNIILRLITTQGLK